MPSPMTVVDLLTAAERVPEAGGLEPLLATPYAHRWLLTVAPGGVWQAPVRDLEEQSLLILEGIASVVIDEWRHSLGAGHLVVAEPGARLGVDADGAERMTALLTVAPAPRAAT